MQKRIFYPKLGNQLEEYIPSKADLSLAIISLLENKYILDQKEIAKINESLPNSLLDLKRRTEENYITQIVPTLGYYLNVLSGKKYNINSLDFRQVTKGQLKNIISAANRKQNSPLESSIVAGLAPDKNVDNDYQEGLYKINGEMLLSYRFKKGEKEEEKTLRYVLKARQGYEGNLALWKDKVQNFILEVTDPNYKYWENLPYFIDKYGMDFIRMLPGDSFGARVSLLQEALAKGRMQTISNNPLILNNNGNQVVKFNDYRNRFGEKTGGLHFILTKQGLPLEVQFWGLSSTALDISGDNHDKYKEDIMSNTNIEYEKHIAEFNKSRSRSLL